MDKRIFLYVVLMYIIKTSAATLCTIRNDGQCYYTVNCDVPARINIVPHCDYTDPYVTLVINQSPVEDVTAHYFKTKFDSYVRMFLAVGNTWDVVQNSAFSNFKNIIYMDLSDNNIKSIGKAFDGLGQLDSLNLSRNHLEVINPGVFKFSENKSRLFLLDLSYNLLTYLSGDFFVNMNNLRKLYLQGNKLTMLGDQYSTNLKSLDYLNLCCTNLRTFNLTLKYFTSLKELDLSHNLLKKVDVSEALSLESIHLSHNNIEDIIFDYFAKMPNLRHLDLSYNKFQEISGSDSVKHANETVPIMRIYLNHNNISYINPTFFQTFSYIRHLNLSHNEYIELRPGTFKYVKDLRVLVVSNCRLKITKNTFMGLEKILLIDISRNNLTTLDPTIFTECTELRRIEADYNMIKTVDIKKFMALVPSLTRITLKGNPRNDITFGKSPLLEIVVDLIMEISSAISMILLVVGTMLILLYVSVHQRVIFILALKCGKCLLLRNRFLN